MTASIADYYDNYWGPDGLNPPSNLTDDLRRFLTERTRGRVLDVGCGDGDTAGLFLKQLGREYVGVDVSRAAVQSARSRDLDARQIDDAASLPFDDNSFDSVVCIEVLEHLWMPNLAAAEILRVLKPGGTFFATCPNVVYWRRRAGILLRGRWNPYGDDLSIEQPWRDPHVRFFTVGAMGRMVTGVGFKNVRVSGHDCTLLSGITQLPQAFRRLDSERFNRFLARRHPSVFADRINVYAIKPH